jgi:thiamine biosynthesis lipoprotein
MLLDLGGIAKGYAADEALAVLQAHGIERALVDGGGGIVAGEAPPDSAGWQIGIAGLTTNEPIAEAVLLVNGSVATSGDANQYIEVDGTRYSHIVDPHTGLGLTHRGSVTVIGPSGTLTDAWATALVVLGQARGRELIGQLSRLEMRFAEMGADGLRVYHSPGFARYRDPSVLTEPPKSTGPAD